MTGADGEQAAPLLLRATELTGKPVVSITEGQALATIKDVIYSPERGCLTGFTLNKFGGLFAGPLKVGLPLGAVVAIGRDAVMVASAQVLVGEPARAVLSEAGSDNQRNVVGNQVITDAGDRLGAVTDLVLEAGVLRRSVGPSAPGQVVGYQLLSDDTAGRDDHQQFVPLPYTLAVSGSNLVVPAEVRPFIRDDLSGFGGAVDSFRAQLGAPPAASPQ